MLFLCERRRCRRIPRAIARAATKKGQPFVIETRDPHDLWKISRIAKKFASTPLFCQHSGAKTSF
jgi:hypothetical protein